MSRRDHDWQHREGEPLDGLDDLLRGIDGPSSAPDQTESIMRRLGYQQVNKATARQHRQQRLARRIAMSFVGAIIVFGAFRMYADSTAVRRPTGPTVPAALQQDLDRQHQRIDRAFDSIRRLAPRPGQLDTPPREPEIDRSAISPGRWI